MMPPKSIGNITHTKCIETIDSKILGPILDYRATKTVRSYAAIANSSTSEDSSKALALAKMLPLSAFNVFIGFLRRPTDILRMQSITHSLVETVTPPYFDTFIVTQKVIFIILKFRLNIDLKG